MKIPFICNLKKPAFASKGDMLELETLWYTHSGLIIDTMGILKCKQTRKCTRKGVDETPVVFFNISNVHF